MVNKTEKVKDDGSPMPYVGRDQREIVLDETPINRVKGWAFRDLPSREDKTEEEILTEELNEQPDDQLAPEEKSFKKRYGDLRRYSQEQEQTFKKQLEELQAQLKEATTKKFSTPAMSDEELEELQTQHPAAYAAIVEVARREDAESKQEVEALRKEMRELVEEKLREKALRILAKLHPDWEEIRNSDEFHEWAKLQPKEVQSWIYENETDGVLAAKAMSFYKSEKGVKPVKSTTTVDASKLVSPKGAKQTPSGQKIWTEVEIQKMSMREYEKQHEEIKKARKEGRITPK